MKKRPIHKREIVKIEDDLEVPHRIEISK